MLDSVPSTQTDCYLDHGRKKSQTWVVLPLNATDCGTVVPKNEKDRDIVVNDFPVFAPEVADELFLRVKI